MLRRPQRVSAVRGRRFARERELRRQQREQRRRLFVELRRRAGLVMHLDVANYLLLRERLSRVRGNVRERRVGPVVRGLMHGMPRGGKWHCDLLRRVVRGDLQRRLPSVRSRLREQRVAPDVRQFVHAMRSRRKRVPDLRRRFVWNCMQPWIRRLRQHAELRVSPARRGASGVRRQQLRCRLQRWKSCRPHRQQQRFSCNCLDPLQWCMSTECKSIH